MIEKEYPTVKLSVGDVIQTEHGDRYFVINTDGLCNRTGNTIPNVLALDGNGIGKEIPISWVTEIIFHDSAFVDTLWNMDKL